MNFRIKSGWGAIALLGALFFTPFASAQTATPEIAKEVKAYKGSENLKVWTLRVGPRAEKEQIVQLEGIDHDWDMRIFKCKLEDVKEETRCVIQNAGQRYVLLIMRDGYGELYLTGENKARGVYYDRELSQHGNAQAFFDNYLKQEKKAK